MSDRDCPHGHQLGKCDTCDLIVAERHIAVLAQRIAELEGDQTIPYESMLADLRGQLCDLQSEIKVLREQVARMPVVVGYVSLSCLENMKRAKSRDRYSLSKHQEEPCFYPVYIDPLPTPPQETGDE